MEYKVVKEWDLDMFEGVVQQLIDEGWTLQGGVSIAVNGQSNNAYYVQALVKESK